MAFQEEVQRKCFESDEHQHVRQANNEHYDESSHKQLKQKEIIEPSRRDESASIAVTSCPCCVTQPPSYRVIPRTSTPQCEQHSGDATRPRTSLKINVQSSDTAISGLKARRCSQASLKPDAAISAGSIPGLTERHNAFVAIHPGKA